MNIDIHIITDMNIEYYINDYTLLMPYWCPSDVYCSAWSSKVSTPLQMATRARDSGPGEPSPTAAPAKADEPESAQEGITSYSAQEGTNSKDNLIDIKYPVYHMYIYIILIIRVIMYIYR